MAASNIRLVLEELRSRLQNVTTGNGFNTDAGSNVYLGEHAEIGPDDDSTAIIIDVRDVEVGEQGLGARSGEEFPIVLRVSVQAVAHADLDEPWIAVEDVRADIKAGVETGAAWPDAVGEIQRKAERSLARQEGNKAVGAEVDYEFLMIEEWGTPDA